MSATTTTFLITPSTSFDAECPFKRLLAVAQNSTLTSRITNRTHKTEGRLTSGGLLAFHETAYLSGELQSLTS
jgi:hypothetical protein